MGQGVIAVYSSLELSFLVLVCTRHIQRQRTSVAAAVISLADALVIGVLSFFEHSRSLRSSALLNSYLFFTLLFDTVQCRTLWLVARGSAITWLFTAAIGVKVVVLMLEAQGKSRWMHPDDKERSPEETAGVFNLSVFFWLKELIGQGSRKVLSLDDLYPLDENLAAEGLQIEFWKQWEQDKLRKGRARLIWVIGKALKCQLLTPILPRLALIGFTFSQPFLINSILNWLETPFHATSANKGYGLIGASALIYTGIAVSTSWYWHRHQRALAKVRGMLTSAIFKKTTQLSITALDNSAAVTLMSTDVEKIQGGCRDLHEIWANIIEAGLASYLLERELGLAFLAPIIVVILCVMASFISGKVTGKRQGAWMRMIQKRVGFTANIISNMTSLKMSGLPKQMGDIVQGLRIDELRSASRVRLLMVVSTVVAFTPLLLTPVITFAVTSRHLDTTRIFTSLSYLLLLSNPLTQLFQSIPQIIAATTCLGRVEKFLETESRIDSRMVRAARDIICKEKINYGDAAIVIRNGNFGWEESRFTLNNINLIIPRSKLTIIVGPIASGKSTLCKVILGETPIAVGDVIFTTRLSQIGFCDQTPFLTSGNVKEEIIGLSNFDSPWYNEVLEATALKQDLCTFPQGDQTMIGTNGMTLSGGQQQRVAMARALYARPDLYVFDDTLRGLDATTEDHVFRSVFGPEGLLRRHQATVVLCSHSVRHLAFADHIVALGAEGTVIEEGSFQSLAVNPKYVHSLGHKPIGVQETGIEIEKLEVGKAPRSPPEVSKPTSELDDRARQVGDVAVYRHYFSILGVHLLISFLTFGMIFGFLYNFSSVWLKYWSDFNTQHPNGGKNAYFNGIYAMLQILCLLALMLFIKRNLTTNVVKTGTLLHQRAISTVMNAPLAFFDTTDTGNTINRFSQDMSLIDADLAFALSNTTLTSFTALGQAAVISIASPYVAIGYPFLIGLLYGIQKFYLRTSRQLRFLDLEAKSPL